MRFMKTVGQYIAIIFFFTASYGFCADVAKIGMVDVQRVIETSSAGKALKSKVNKQKNQMTQELEKRGKEIEALEKRFEREAMVMSPEKREEKKREVDIKKYDFKKLQKSYIAESRQVGMQLSRSIQIDILGLVKDIGKKEGYLLIIDKNSVLYAPTTIEVTDKLIQKYNDKFAKGDGEAAKIANK